MIRNANVSDIPRIFEIRGAVHENKLRDPSRVTIEDLRWLIANPGTFVWDDDGRIVGFSAADPRDGSIFALFVAPAFEGREFGRLLFERACTVLRKDASVCGLRLLRGLAPRGFISRPAGK